MNRESTSREAPLAVLLAVLLSFSVLVYAEPQGASINDNSTDTGPTFTADNRTDDGGTINTLTLDSTGQNLDWKAYIGNVTGSLTLDDSNENTIYDWQNLDSVSGEAYVARNNTIDWGGVSCASSSTISSEQSDLGFDPGESDNINFTFNYSQHPQMTVGSKDIPQDNCSATYMYNDNTSQSASSSNNFTTILLEDSNSNLVYGTFLEDKKTGFDGKAYDFQTIVPDEETTATPYYFYLELS